MRRLPLFAMCLLTIVVTQANAAEVWSRFRGENGGRAAAGSKLPTEIAPDKHVAWKIDLAQDIRRRSCSAIEFM